MYMTNLNNTNEMLDIGIWEAHDDGSYSLDLNIPAVYYTGERMVTYTITKKEDGSYFAKRDIYADHLKSRKIEYDSVSFDMGKHELEDVLEFLSRDFGNVFDLYQHKIKEVFIEVFEDDEDRTSITDFLSKEDVMIEDTFIDDVIRFLEVLDEADEVAHIHIIYDDDCKSEKEIIIDSRNEEDEDEDDDDIYLDFDETETM